VHADAGTASAERGSAKRESNRADAPHNVGREDNDKYQINGGPDDSTDADSGPWSGEEITQRKQDGRQPNGCDDCGTERAQDGVHGHAEHALADYNQCDLGANGDTRLNPRNRDDSAVH
jgi:hypothetical protein